MDSMIYGNIIKADLDKPLLRLNVGTVMASGDELANRYGAQLHRSGVDVDASAYSVLGYLIRPNDETLKIHGTASGNMVYVDIPQTGYVYDGAFTLTIKVYGDGFEKAIVIFDGKIAKTTTETIVDGDRVVYGVEEILAQIDAMEKAESDASAAATNANTAASAANTAATSATNAASSASTAAAKIDGMTVSAVDAEEAAATITEVNGVKHITFSLPQGPAGPVGPAGADGTMSFEELTDEQRESLRGADGEDGEDGYTPVKGTDYWTEADKAEMVSDVLAALPTWNGGDY